MKKNLNFAVFALTLVLLTITGLARGQQKPDAKVQKAASSWLALVDTGKYAQSWDQASGYFKSKITKAQWVARAGQVRTQLGKLKSRGAATPQYLKNPPNAPAGEYARLQYTSAFGNLPAATETCALRLEKDAEWRVVGYFIKPN